ncbi:hypothetical protein [Ancylomarina sp. 16SWW S1-10-2]|uniref:hypothetical protein n=1 Tax=Ancylomarina sp. 16SWW S1-10-2 TaxID=2499681 RepID=UPI0012AD38CE|nr:hypothetical protein [Ancylomarina sp. 16SWW S1-10-2]MRT94064.1 hypothetical protein [Ancylomarina sp. 16SWW S1-10-2]
MNDKIDNRIAFSIYIWMYFGFCFLLYNSLGIILYSTKTNNKILFHNTIEFSLAICTLSMLIFIFDYFIKPAYFEAKISNGRLNIKTYNPSKRFFILRFVSMLNYKKNTIEYVIDRQSYNNYKVSIGLWGLRKYIRLQKIDKSEIFESKSINISFLGLKKYTNLILSLDRIKEKITLN